MMGTTDGSHWLRASIDRVAISHALIERGYLLIGSRRVYSTDYTSICEPNNVRGTIDER